jgi:hypothetical protein
MPPGYGYLTRHLRTRQLTLGEAVQLADRRVLVLGMRKEHDFTPKYIHVQAPTATMNRHRHPRCHYKWNSGSTSAGTNNPPRLESLRSNRTPTDGPLTPTPVAVTMTSAPGGQTAAVMTSGQTPLRQGPCPRPRPRGKDMRKAVELEVSPRVAPTISSVEKPLPAASVGGGTGSSAKADQAEEPDTRQLPAPRTANALPPDH